MDYIFCALISIFRAVILESLLSDQPWTTAAPTSMTCPCVFLHSLHALYFTLPHCRAMVFIWGPWGPQHWTYWMFHLSDTPNSGQLISWWYNQVFSIKDTSKICSTEVLQIQEWEPLTWRAKRATYFNVLSRMRVFFLQFLGHSCVSWPGSHLWGFYFFMSYNDLSNPQRRCVFMCTFPNLSSMQGRLNDDTFMNRAILLASSAAEPIKKIIGMHNK